jgi:hypothetical protein
MTRNEKMAPILKLKIQWAVKKNIQS